jgi:hypothetical protein
MSHAYVSDVDAIKAFRTAMVKFIETVSVALADADADIARTLGWLETQQAPYWNSQIRKRQELVTRCKDAVRQKTLYKDSLGRTQSAVDEMKALQRAQRLLDEAEQKLQLTKQYHRRLQRQQQEYRGQVAKLQLSLTGDLPHVVVKLGNLVGLIQEYGSTESPGEAKSAAAVGSESTEPTEKKEPADGTV